MPFELWGATTAPRLMLPERPLGYILLAAYSLVLLLAVYRYRLHIRHLSGRQWLLTLALSLGTLIFSQLLLIPLRSDNQLPPLGSAQNPLATLAPLGAVLFVLAGALLNPAAALFVGLSSGLGRALWQSHQILDPFQWGFAALLTASLLEQNYAGRLYRWLRQPALAGPVGTLFILPLVGLAAFAYADASAGPLAALDLAISTTQAHLLPLLVEGALGGLIVTLLQVGLPQLRRAPYPLVPSPPNQSLNSRLLTNFVLFASLLTVLLIIVGFNLALRVSSNIAVVQMAQDAQAVSARIPDFRAHRQHLLTEYSQDATLLSANAAGKEEVLLRLFRTGDFYRRIMLVDKAQRVNSYYPQDAENVSLTNLESAAVVETLSTSAPFISPAQAMDDGHYVISFIVPVVNGNGEAEAALVGRVPDISLDDLIVGLQGTLEKGSGFLVDEQGQIIAHPEPANLLTAWQPPETGHRLIPVEDEPGVAYEGRAGNTNARQLVYYQTGPNHPWTVVVTLPYEIVLELALEISARLTLVLMAALVLFGVYLLVLGRSITQPLTELAQVSQRIAGGSLNTPIQTQGDDEIGRLGQAFAQMQISLKKRLDELSLLLGVSQEVSSTIELSQGMPAILQGALKGTGAAGVRVVVLNPSGRQPLTFGEGAAARVMADFDRRVMSLIRQHSEMILTGQEEVSARLITDRNRELPVKAMIALPLATHVRFQGVLWLTYRQPHEFDQTELNFLRTLAGQASVLVENARLFATAEGGRRRLAAVLASTSDAVIVTDQTERVLLINPAMERYFNLNATEIMGRPIADVIKSDRLVEALTSSSQRARNVEMATPDGKVLYASASTIFSNDGQVMGRVAVLHDITYLKEVDEMKSEFVATVSHDLRSPLTFMRGYATMLPMIGELNPKQQEYVDKILNGIEQMSGLVNDLLDLGRLEAGVDLVMSRFRVEELLNSVADEHRQPAQSKGIDLVVEAARNLPPINADMSLIRQAVTNFVSNTLKYAPDSGEVVLGAVLENNDLVISVQDHGPGIPKKDQLRLFEKFYRVQQRGTAGVKGSGLGLALVKSIAERHGGRTWCESDVGQGSTFFISLPLNGAG
ncbi:MAG: ATP-binding protein, partial [Chloroflexi bacterium]|nr:ATP-binding protein [Chloroflexota bacterium]